MMAYLVYVVFVGLQKAQTEVKVILAPGTYMIWERDYESMKYGIK